jgi:plasmid stabilization system protein ParE
VKAVRPGSFTQEIESDIRRYESECAGLGARLWRDLQRTIERISEYPPVGEIVSRTRHRVRRVPFRDFPFFVIYRERDEFIEIIAVAHTGRRPSYWRSRMPA